MEILKTTLFVIILASTWEYTATEKGNETNIQQNFQHLINAIGRNDTKQANVYEKILREEVIESKQAYGAVKDDISRARYRHSHKRTNFFFGNRSVTDKRQSNLKSEAEWEKAYFVFDKEMERFVDDKVYRTECRERVVICRLEKKDEAEDKIVFREQKDILGRPQQLLLLRSKLEDKINYCYGPGGKPADKGYMAALNDILLSTEKKFTLQPRIIEFRQMVLAGGFEHLEDFLAVARELNELFSTKAAHKLTGLITKLPSSTDVKEITKILEDTGMPTDTGKIMAIQLILKPSAETRTTIDGEERCLVFKSVYQHDVDLFKPKSEENILKDDVFLAFPKLKPLRAAWLTFTLKNNKLVYGIQVEFKSEGDAKNGVHNNHGWFKSVRVRAEKSACYDHSDTDVVVEEMLSPGETELTD